MGCLLLFFLFNREQHNVAEFGRQGVVPCLHVHSKRKHSISDRMVVSTHLKARTGAPTWKSCEMSDASTQTDLVRKDTFIHVVGCTKCLKLLLVMR